MWGAEGVWHGHRHAAAGGRSRRPAGSRSKAGDPLPWSRVEQGSTAAAPWVEVEGPQLRAIETTPEAGGRRVRTTLASPRGAPLAQILLRDPPASPPPALGGEEVPPDRTPIRSIATGRCPHRLDASPPRDRGRDERGGGRAAGADLVDRTYDLPSVAAPLVAARPPTRAPNQNGDSTIVIRPSRSEYGTQAPLRRAARAGIDRSVFQSSKTGAQPSSSDLTPSNLRSCYNAAGRTLEPARARRQDARKLSLALALTSGVLNRFAADRGAADSRHSVGCSRLSEPTGDWTGDDVDGTITVELESATGYGPGLRYRFSDAFSVGAALLTAKHDVRVSVVARRGTVGDASSRRS